RIDRVPPAHKQSENSYPENGRSQGSIRSDAAVGKAADPKPDDAMAVLADAHRQISNLLREMPSPVAPEVARFGLAGALRRAVEDEFPGAFDQVTWHVDPEAVQRLETISPLTAEVLFYATREAVRNAARYGRGP